MQRFSWSHILSLVSKDKRCEELLSLALSSRKIPDKCSGRMKIYQWLDSLRAPGYLYVSVRELEIEWNQKINKALSWD